MFDAILRSWPSAPWLTFSLLITAAVYTIGWGKLNRRDPGRWTLSRIAAFMSGLAVIYLALASPIEVFSSFLLTAHMMQHLLLIIVGPPLSWLGWPMLPMLRGLPEPVRRYWAAPILRSRLLNAVFSRLIHPLVAWPIFVAVMWFWHLPPAYNLGLRNEYWHILQHLCFIGAALLFWYPVVRPYPTRPSWPKWWLLPYLLLADIQNTVLAAWITFSSKVLYPHYEQVPRWDGISALADQHAAGVLMWVPGSLALLAPMFWIALTYLLPTGNRPLQRGHRALTSIPVTPTRFDLLRTPAVARFLRWRFSRRVLQGIVGLAAVLVIVDGLWGPQYAPMNLAGVAPWIHWRGLLILSLLVAGNFFCMACPFTLPRTLASRLLPAGRPWPSWLRNKWLAVALVALFLWSYEAFALWNNPWITAWIAIGYFVAAFAVDSFFSAGSFCKYVCPIGQFNFVQSLVSPLAVAVREPGICTACTSRECISGNGVIAGCSSQLYQPHKVGNVDCTFCLDCARACPHENVGILTSFPTHTLWHDPMRSGIGRFSQRYDLAVLVVLLVFGAFANAAGMVGPVVEWQDQFAQLFGIATPGVVTSVTYLIVLLVLPLCLVVLVSCISRRWAKLPESTLRIAARFAYALVPLGFAMWLAHYSFHFFTSWRSLWPVTQRLAQDSGWTLLGTPAWACACCAGAAPWILRAELLFLGVGLLGSLYAGFRIAERNATSTSQATRSFAPWGTLMALMFVVAVWIVYQPMQMRGTIPLANASSQLQ